MVRFIHIFNITGRVE